MGLDRAYVDQCFNDIVEFSELESFIDVPVKHYSSGMYVRLGFSVAIHSQPDILLIDEVLAVGDESFQHKCVGKITELRESGVTILLVTHSLDTVETLCDRAIWFEHGRVAQLGDSRDVTMAYRHRVAQLEDARTVDPDSRHAHVEMHRWGNRKIEITSVELVDDDGQEASVFRTNQAMNVDIHYLVHSPVDGVAFGLAVHHQSGAHISGPNTKFAGHVIDNLKREGVMRYRIPSLTLLEGAYVLSVSVTDESLMVMYDYHDRLYPFRVYRGESREIYGLVTLRGEWVF
jgi:lipopolysaccharide transport system ATP-binding protein